MPEVVVYNYRCDVAILTYKIHNIYSSLPIFNTDYCLFLRVNALSICLITAVALTFSIPAKLGFIMYLSLFEWLQENLKMSLVPQICQLRVTWTISSIDWDHSWGLAKLNGCVYLVTATVVWTVEATVYSIVQRNLFCVSSSAHFYLGAKNSKAWIILRFSVYTSCTTCTSSSGSGDLNLEYLACL